MKYLAILLFLFSHAAIAQEKSFQDGSIFRVQSTIFFLSDVKEIAEGLVVYKCIYPRQMVWDHLSLSRSDLQKILSLRPTAADKVKFKQEIRKLLLLAQVMSYVQDQDVRISQKVDQLLAKKLSKGKCGKKESLPIIKKLVQIETFFQNRFSEKSFWVTDEELKKAQSAHLGAKKLKRSKLKKRLLKAKIDMELQSFLRTLRGQIPYDFL